ncbi:hypothetical protein [Prauserella endophytica]|uniref:Lipoprotein n=1 Tax=Prauserella endophytica TaxID=1592324 RepID=A0ABY2RSX2_9PSEU|nr:hypothetical protein [Prauserella endophytica]TKG59028.1 hypothetical protein FCN18_37260 [Prauserella endophytica]
MLIRSRAVLALLLLLVVAGCSQQVGGTASAPENAGSSRSAEPSAEPTSQEPSSTPASSSIDVSQLPGTWRGSYFCAQGETGLELEVSPAEGDTVPAVFSFFPVEGGPPTPSGSFKVNGVEENGQFVFRQDAWIEQPEGFVMVDLGVASVENGTMTGRVGGPGCDAFSLTKEN